MRLGGPVFGDASDPEKWITLLRQQNYRAAYCPLDNKASDDLVHAYAQAAEKADIIIAEVGAWSNPLSQDAETRRKAIAHCQAQLALAERIGARCCVNIAGSRGEIWDGPNPDNFTPDTFDLLVTTVREILDAVQPTRTFYTLETMPWMYPDSPANYAKLLQAIDRPAFGVHLDIVNMIYSPHLYYENAALIRECFTLLGPHIKSVHAKDITLASRLTVHLDEVRPGLGSLDWPAFLQAMNNLPADTPLMLEHLPNAEEYALAAQHIRDVAQDNGITL